MQKVGIYAERRLAALVARDRNLVLLGIFDKFGPRAEIPFTPGRDHPDIGLQRVIGELEADLVIALAGGAVRDGVSADGAGNLDLALGNQRARNRRAQKIHAFIKRVGAEHREDVVSHEFLAEVFDEDLLDAQHLCLGARRFHLFALADIGGEGDNFGTIAVLQPAQDDRCVEPAGIGKHDLFDLILFHGGCLSRSPVAPQRRFSRAFGLFRRRRGRRFWVVLWRRGQTVAELWQVSHMTRCLLSQRIPPP